MPTPKHLPLSQTVLSSTLLVLNVFIVSGLFISNYWHRDNNYGIRADQFSVRSIAEDEYQQLPPEKQIYWAHAAAPATYLHVTIDNSFVSYHKNNAVIIMLPFSLFALFLCGVAFHNGRRTTPSSAAAGCPRGSMPSSMAGSAAPR